jgi:glycosyltransferase involved in cell wall biosynthesis
MRKGHRFRSSPLVTVAMVTYNSGRFVRDAIQSVLAQDCDDFELLVSDDCSHDDTWDIVNTFDDRRIRAVRNDANLGEYLNRNKALALARGKYLMYLDGDDLLYSFGLGLMVKAMERFPGAAFSAGLPQTDKFIYPVELTPAQYCRCTFLGPIVLTSNFTQLLFRTEAIKSVGGFDLRYRTGDLYIQYLLGSRRNVLLVSNGLAWWRKRPGQASEALVACGRPVVEMWRYCREILDDPSCPLDPREKAMARENLSRMVLRNAALMLLKGRVANAMEMALRTGIPWNEWHSILRPYKKPYLSEVTGNRPIHLAIDRETPSIVIPSEPAHSTSRKWRLPSREPHPAAIAKRSTMELATPAE